MSPATEQWSKLEALFQAATQLPGAEHDAFVKHACGGNTELELRLRRMLALDHSQGMLDDPPTSTISSGGRCAETLIGRRIGRFEITRVIASGGMGTVYEARQDHPRRNVALKVMNSGALAFSRTALRRFESETDILGRLQHHAIAQIYEAGVFEFDHGPQPYFAMELIDGLPITKFASHRELGTREMLELMRKVCEAVDYAHSQGVIHRDLKPANILVDGVGQPKILDFGIARIVGNGVNQATTLRTDVGQLLGTISYMSPEQVAGDPSQIDARSDVYSLGVVAYELLTGRLPHDVQSRPIPEAMRMILDDEPTPLSSVVKLFRGDLDTIIGKALEKDRTRRYATARELADDIGRYLADQAVLARRPSALYQLRKFARRNKVLVAGMLGIVAALTIGVIGTSMGLVRAERAADEQARLRSIADAQALRAAAAEADARRRLDESIRLLTELVTAYEALSDVPGATQAREALALQTIRHLPHGAGEHTDNMANFAAYAYQRLGEVQLVMGQSSAALESHQRSLRIRLAHVDLEPHNVDALRSLAVGHWKVAEALVALNELEASQSHNVASVAILDRLAILDPHNQTMAHYFGAAHRRIAEVEFAQALYEQSKQSFAESLMHFDEQLAIFPDNLPTRQGKAMAWRGLGEAALALGQFSEAQQAIDASLEMIEDLARASGQSNVFARTHEALAFLAMSRVRSARGEMELASAAAARAKAIADALAHADEHHEESHQLAARCRAVLKELTGN